MITQRTADTTPAAPAPQRNPWLILFVLCLGFFMILLDTTIVNIAIPNLIDDLGATLNQILWILNAYILVYAVLLLLGPLLALVDCLAGGAPEQDDLRDERASLDRAGLERIVACAFRGGGGLPVGQHDRGGEALELGPGRQRRIALVAGHDRLRGELRGELHRRATASGAGEAKGHGSSREK